MEVANSTRCPLPHLWSPLLALLRTFWEHRRGPWAWVGIPGGFLDVPGLALRGQVPVPFPRVTSVLTARGQHRGESKNFPRSWGAPGPGGILSPGMDVPGRARGGSRSPSAWLQPCPLLREQSAPARAFLMFFKEQKQNKGGLSLKHKQRAALWD